MSSNPAINSTPKLPPRTKSPEETTSVKKSPPVKILGKYRILKKIGSGGMGTVFLAEHMELDRIVALKVLPVSKATNPILVKRFKAEARAAANLKHQNIVTVYEAGEADGRFYIALEYIEGQDILVILRKEGMMSVKRSVDIVLQTAEALQHAYQQNIVHRDIKPSNLLIDTDEVVKLTDMGLARTMDDSAQTGITRDGTTVGTVDYMSPEQARDSKAADIRSDIYSLGCTWYQMLTLKVPFGKGSMTNKLNAHASQPPPDPCSLNDKIPESIVAVMHRMLAKNPEDRYQTPQDLIDDLETVSLKQRNVSDDVLSGLSGKKKRKRQLGSSSSKKRGLPPKNKSAKSSNDEDSSGFHVAPFKFAIMGVISAAVLIGIYWLTSTVGSALDSAPLPTDENQNQVTQPEEKETAPKKTSEKETVKNAPPISREDPDGTTSTLKVPDSTGLTPIEMEPTTPSDNEPKSVKPGGLTRINKPPTTPKGKDPKGMSPKKEDPKKPKIKTGF